MKTTVESRNYLSVGEVARELRVSTASVYRACDDGTLPHIQLRPNGVLRIPVGALSATSAGKDQPSYRKFKKVAG